jgi:phytoene dehydrogenase-like protein
VEDPLVLVPLLTAPPPSVESPDTRDLWNMLKAGRRLRGLGPLDEYRLLRWAPMPAADFAAEWFDSDVLRALIAARGISGTMLGPRSAGSTLVLLLHEAMRLLAGRAGQPRGGPGALTRAMAAAAQAAGAEIRTGTPVEHILSDGDKVTGVVAGGRELYADCVVSGVDPKTTFLQLMDAGHLSPEFLSNVRNYRTQGTVAKINLALSELPRFPSPSTATSDMAFELLSGRIHIGPDLDYLERAFDHAKYGEISDEPWLDIRIPSILDDGLCPREAHVMSVYVHYAPYRLRTNDWSTQKDGLLKRVLSVIERFAPGIERLVIASQTITPPELERELGIQGGHYFHGELALDQLFVMRPFLGHARYDSPVAGLYLCSAGTHPGGFMSGGSGKLAAQEIIRALKRKAARPSR